ncbi:MAG: ABC transporter substrate-binding protein [Deltaproteobacteria bacterium]|nr:ABC transporter substrate-binding protein [Deltaproteobacteria bacterium]MBW2136134.1 ABC transporter substrate-binding protein [Deltaproteobacteria bacterium]
MWIGLVIRITAVVLVCLFVPVTLWAGEPTQRIKETTDKLIAILEDRALKVPEKKDEKIRLLRKIVDERFDWEAISRRALGRHWRKLTGEERKEFVRLFGKLLERTYSGKLESYSGETVSYDKEAVDGRYAVVQATVKSQKHGEIPIKYRLWKRNGDWLVYDISIEGVSLVNNYRSQFNEILMKSPPKKLIRTLEEKVREKS